MKKNLVVGSLNMDQVTKVHLTPKVGETVIGDGLDYFPGGKGANQAVAIGKLGAEVKMVGMVGDDNAGQSLRSNLVQNGVEDAVLVTQSSPTGTAIIMVNASSDNSIVVIPGANAELTCDCIKEEWFDQVSSVIMQLEIPVETVDEVLKMAKSKNIKTILNPAPAKQLSHALLKNVDLLIVNETEFETLTELHFHDEPDFYKGYEQLGVKELILTLGAKGSWYFDGKSRVVTDGLKVKAVDTTAAGDSFIGGLMYGLSRNLDMTDALKLATEVAAVTVTRLGAQSSLPTFEEILERRKN